MRGHRLQVLTSNHRLPPMGLQGEKGVYRDLLLHDVVEPEKVADLPYRLLHAHELSNARALYQRIDRFKPDIVYVWNMNRLSKSLLFSLQEQGISVAYDLHCHWLRQELFDSDPWFHWWKDRQGWKMKIFKLYLKLTGQKRRQLKNFPIGAVVGLDLSMASVCSESLRRDLLASGVTQAALSPLLYPALNTNYLVMKKRYQRARRFMWAGRLNADKAPGVALRAVAVLKDRGINVLVDFFGMGEPLERKSMRNLIDASGLGDSVHMLGIRPGALMSKYSEYDAFLFTSGSNDPFPISPLEAMRCGLPCILARNGGITEVSKENETALLYEAGDAEALADAMQRMMALEDGGASMAKNCTESLQGKHSLANVVNNIEAFLSASSDSNSTKNNDQQNRYPRY